MIDHETMATMSIAELLVEINRMWWYTGEMLETIQAQQQCREPDYAYTFEAYLNRSKRRTAEIMARLEADQ